MRRWIIRLGPEHKVVYLSDFCLCGSGCGSGLARDGINTVCLTDRSVCIAGKPAPTVFVAPTKFKLGREHCGSELARDGITAVRLTDRSVGIAGKPAPTGFVLLTEFGPCRAHYVGASLLAMASLRFA